MKDGYNEDSGLTILCTYKAQGSEMLQKYRLDRKNFLTMGLLSPRTDYLEQECQTYGPHSRSSVLDYQWTTGCWALLGMWPITESGGPGGHGDWWQEREATHFSEIASQVDMPSGDEVIQLQNCNSDRAIEVRER